MRMYTVQTTDLGDLIFAFVAAESRGKAKAFFVNHFSALESVEWTTPISIKCLDKDAPYEAGVQRDRDMNAIADRYGIHLIWEGKDD